MFECNRVSKQMETQGSGRRSALKAHAAFLHPKGTFGAEAVLIDCYRTIDNLKAAGFS